jgi:hypothetical protein
MTGWRRFRTEKDRQGPELPAATFKPWLSAIGGRMPAGRQCASQGTAAWSAILPP